MSAPIPRKGHQRLERIAEILVDAYITRDDRETGARYGITDRTLRNWRRELERNPELADLFRAKKAKASEGWADEVPGALRAAVGFLRRAAEEGDPKDAKMVHSVAGALKMLSETAATWKILDARFPADDRSDRKQPRPMAAQRGATAPN
jgi:hypothetical protein